MVSLRPYPFKFFKGCLPQNLLSPYFVPNKFLSLRLQINFNQTSWEILYNTILSILCHFLGILVAFFCKSSQFTYIGWCNFSQRTHWSNEIYCIIWIYFWRKNFIVLLKFHLLLLTTCSKNCVNDKISRAFIEKFCQAIRYHSGTNFYSKRSYNQSWVWLFSLKDTCCMMSFKNLLSVLCLSVSLLYSTKNPKTGLYFRTSISSWFSLWWLFQSSILLSSFRFYVFVKLSYTFAIFFSYFIQFYVPMQILIPPLQKGLAHNCRTGIDIFVRVAMVVTTCKLVQVN